MKSKQFYVLKLVPWSKHVYVLKLHNAETSDRGAQGLAIHPITKH